MTQGRSAPFPNDRPLGIGLVGCGRIARLFHLPTLAGFEGVRVVAVADPDPGARSAAQDVVPTAATYASPEDLVALDSVDAVVVCTPTAQHARVAVAALDAGHHVYVEKPLALDLAEASEVLASQERAKKVAMVGFNLRFHPAYEDARERLAAGEIGSLVAIRSVFASAPRELPGWKRRRETGGGALLDLASHHVDLVRHLTGEEIVGVTSHLRSVLSHHDTASVGLVTESGVGVQSLFSLSTTQSDRLELYGTEGTIEADRYRELRARVRPLAPAPGRGGRLLAAAGALGEVSTGVRSAAGPPADPSFRAALSAFVAAARAGRLSGPDLGDGHASLQVVLAAEQASVAGARVEVEPRRRPTTDASTRDPSEHRTAP